MASTPQTNPLFWNAPIVDKAGLPTQDFQRRWAKQQQINTTIKDLSNAAAVSAILDFIGDTVGELLVRGTSAWETLAPVSDGRVLRDQGVGNAPIWDTISNVLDKIASARGSVIYRGNSAWAALVPGTAGDVLTTNGAGADPTWETPTGGGGLPGGSSGEIQYNDSGAFGGFTASGDASINTTTGAITIANDAVTYQKMQNVTATKRILGRKTAAAGDVEECTLSEVLDFITSAAQGDLLYRDATAWTRLAAGTAGFVLSTAGAGANPAWVAASSVTSASDAAFDAMWFGDGSDGVGTITGAVTITKDMFYSSLTISGVGAIFTNGYKIHVSGTLDLTAANAGAIKNTGGTGANGTQFAGGTAGSSSVLPADGSIGGASGLGTAGATATTGAGAQSAAVSSITQALVNSAAGGAGGNVGGTAGGSSRAAPVPVVTARNDIRYLSQELSSWVSNSWSRLVAGCSAPGGSSGAGDGTGRGGGGGGGGAGGGAMWIAAKIISRGASTAVGAIQAKGGAGGAGASGDVAGTNHGGGGGGGGGAGGWIVLIYRTLTGSVATGAIDATGGNGGAGANGVGTGIGGDSGGGGGGGRIDVYDLAAGTQSITGPTAALAGNAHSSGTGGATKTAAAVQVNL